MRRSRGASESRPTSVGDRLVQARVRRGPGPRLWPGSGSDAAAPVGARMVEHRLVRFTFAVLGPSPTSTPTSTRCFAFFADPANCDSTRRTGAGWRRLRESGLGLGMISNFDYRIYAILDALGLRRYFDSITISSEAGYAKPAPRDFSPRAAAPFIDGRRMRATSETRRRSTSWGRMRGIAVVLVDPDVTLSR